MGNLVSQTLKLIFCDLGAHTDSQICGIGNINLVLGAGQEYIHNIHKILIIHF